MVGAELQRDFSDRRGFAQNLLLAVAAESLGAAAEIMLLPSLVLAFFVAELTPSYATIGLVPAIASGFWTLARLPAHLVTRAHRRQRPWAFAAALVRAGAVAVLAVVTARSSPDSLAQTARPLLGTLFLCLIVYSLAGGFGSVPAAALLRAAVPAGLWDSLVRRRSLFSAVLCLAAALLVRGLLGTNGSAFPGNYGRLFLIAAAILAAVAALTAFVREPRGVATSAMQDGGPAALRRPFYDARFRRFLLFRVLLSSSAAIDPFLFLYVVTRLGVPVTAIGEYVLAGVLGWIATTPLWFALERRSGPRALLQGASVIRLVAPALALVLPQLAATGPLRERLFSGFSLTTVFAVAFFAIGAALAAQSRGNCGYLLALAPRPRTYAYAGLTNAVLAVIAFSPAVGGMIIQRSGYEALFTIAAALGLAAVFAGGWLAETPGARISASARSGSNDQRALSSARA